MNYRRVSSPSPTCGSPIPEYGAGFGGRLLPPRATRSLVALRQLAASPHARFSQPDLHAPALLTVAVSPPAQRRRLPQIGAAPNAAALPRRYLKRCPQSDLSHRFQRLQEQRSNESTPSGDTPIDPVYMALKQATGRYGSTNNSRRGSSAHPLDSHSPSPSTLSRVSLQDSGYVDMPRQSNPLLGSTPQLDHTGRAPVCRRAPKLTTQMKSLSLDYDRVDRPPPVSRSPATRTPNKLMTTSRGTKGSSDLSDWERSLSPAATASSRRGSSQTSGYIVVHEYQPSNGAGVYIGERLHIVNNGDPDWLHGFRINDRTEQLLTFPATCVAKISAGEQPMRILQNVMIPEIKLRLYRDQPDSIVDGRVTVRTERDVFAPCRLEYLTLL